MPTRARILPLAARHVRAAARVALASSGATYRDLPLANRAAVRIAIARQSPIALDARLRRHVGRGTARIAAIAGAPQAIALWHAAPGRLYCEWLFVHPAAQGRGLGTALLAAMRAVAARRHRLLELDCLDRNTRSLDWYRARGFREVRRVRKRWRQATLTAVVLRLATAGS